VKKSEAPKKGLVNVCYFFIFAEDLPTLKTHCHAAFGKNTGNYTRKQLYQQRFKLDTI
jgi:hypothetical protein